MSSQKRGSKPAVKIFFFLFGFAVLALLFQNCGEAFTVDSTQLNSVISTAGSASETKPGVSYDEFKSCRTNSEANLASCLENKSPVKGKLSSSAFDTCLAAGSSDLDLAACLTQTGFIIANYREPMQRDFENCASAVGTGKITTCLAKNGILPLGVDQVGIEDCVAKVGLGAVEICLRKKGLLKRFGTVANPDIALCKKVYGNPISDINLLNCLIGKELAPATLTEAQVAQCQMAAPSATAKCLRTNRFVPRLLAQGQISRCINFVGVGSTAACLDSNGFLYDKLLPVDALQTQINTCNTNAGPAGIAKCLRTNGFLEKKIMQGSISACALTAGTPNTVACLTANGLLTNGAALNSPMGTTITQADVDDCVAKGNVTTVAKCLVTKNLLAAKPTQDNFEFCHRLATPANIATCLDASGMLPTGVTQANFDTCLAASGLAGLETCMKNRGFIP